MTRALETALLRFLAFGVPERIPFRLNMPDYVPQCGPTEEWLLRLGMRLVHGAVLHPDLIGLLLSLHTRGDRVAMGIAYQGALGLREFVDRQAELAGASLPEAGWTVRAGGCLTGWGIEIVLPRADAGEDRAASLEAQHLMAIVDRYLPWLTCRPSPDFDAANRSECVEWILSSPDDDHLHGSTRN